VSEYSDQIAQLQYEASQLPTGPTQVALLDEAVRLADLHHNEQLGYDLRILLTRAALFSGRVDLLLVHFAWLCATFDRRPDQFDEFRFLWRYKWVAGNTSVFAEVSRAKIDELLNDLERRCDAVGYGDHAVATTRRDCYVDLHDVAAAQQANDVYLRTHRDHFSDCEACVVGMDGDYFGAQELWAEQLQTIEPLLAGRVRSCTSQPIKAVTRALLPLVRLGRVDEARQLQLRYMRRLQQNAHHSSHAAHHVTFLALTGQRKVAQKLFNRYLHEGFDTVLLIDRLRYLRAGLVVLGCALADGDNAPVTLPAHTLLPPAGAKGKHEIAPLRDWMLAESLRIAAAYDARNGNDFETRETLDCQKLVEQLAVRN